MKQVLYIEGRRDGYTPQQCGSTLTVGELIAYLAEFEPETELYLKNDGGYTYGCIDWDSFDDAVIDEDE